MFGLLRSLMGNQMPDQEELMKLMRSLQGTGKMFGIGNPNSGSVLDIPQMLGQDIGREMQMMMKSLQRYAPKNQGPRGPWTNLGIKG